MRVDRVRGERGIGATGRWAVDDVFRDLVVLLPFPAQRNVSLRCTLGGLAHLRKSASVARRSSSPPPSSPLAFFLVFCSTFFACFCFFAALTCCQVSRRFENSGGEGCSRRTAALLDDCLAFLPMALEPVVELRTRKTAHRV